MSGSGSTSTGDAPPFWKERRWLRLGVATICSLLVTGIMPGATLFVQLFVDAGVGASACKGAVSGCDQQQIFVGESFNAAMSVTLFGFLIAGAAFDRAGGLWTGQVGAGMVCVGFILLQIPFLGAKYGYDAQTSHMLPWALVISDAGSLLNSMSIFSLLFHFPDHQTFVIALMGSSNTSTAVLPNFLSVLMDRTGLQLHVFFLAWTGINAICYVIVRYTIPTMAEYRAEAKKVLGFALPRADRQSVCQAVKDVHLVLRQHWGRHILFVTSCGSAIGMVMIYSTLAGDYGQLMFKSKAEGENLAGMLTKMSAFNGSFLVPIITLIADRLGYGLQIVTVILVGSCALLNLYIGTPTWPAQEITGMLVTIFITIESTVWLKYSMAFAMPNRIGTFNGVLCAYVMIASMFMMAGTFTCINSLPSDTLDHLRVPFQGATLAGTVALIVWAAHFMYMGTPAIPVVLAKDEAEMSLAFGCTNFDEVARVTGVQDRHEVIRMLNSTDSKAFKDLLQRVDFGLIEEAPAVAMASTTAAVHDVERAAHSTEPSVPPAQAHEKQKMATMEEVPLAPVQSTVLASVPRPGEITICALTCQSGGSQSRWEWTSSPMGVLFGCCAAGPRQDNLHEVRVPLLQQQRASSEPDRSNEARALNMKLMDLIRSKDKEGILHMYETEDTQLLWDSYLDLRDMVEKAELEKIEAEFDELVPEDEFMALTIKRPELRILFAKMIANKVKEAAFGR